MAPASGWGGNRYRTRGVRAGICSKHKVCPSALAFKTKKPSLGNVISIRFCMVFERGRPPPVFPNTSQAGGEKRAELLRWMLVRCGGEPAV